MIPIIDLQEEYRQIKLKIQLVIEKILENSSFILGQECEKFEKEFADYLGIRYGIAVNSGSDALFLALRALGIKNGDEVITVPNTFISTVDAISRNNGTPVFVDIDPNSYCINPKLIEEKITNKTRAIIPVHLYGHPAEMDEIIKIAKKHKLFVVEDCAQAAGAEFKGKKVGGFGDIGCFSFYPTKNIGAYGDGGMMVTNNSNTAKLLRMLRNYGSAKKYHYQIIGINSRLDEIQAAILRIKLRYLDEWNLQRQEIASAYNKLLNKTTNVPNGNYIKHAYYLYTIKHKDRDKLQKYLQNEGIETMIHYPIPVHLQESYSYLGYRRGSLPRAEKVSKQVLSLPMHPFLTSKEVQRIANLVNNFSA